MGRHPLPEHAAWVMAFTQNSQMPRQLIRLLNASCINSTHTLRQQRHTPWNKLPTFSLPSREEDVLIEHFGWLLTLILDVSNGAAWCESGGITHRIPAGEGLCFDSHPPRSRKLLLNKQDLSGDEHVVASTEREPLTHFFILYTCSETPVFRRPRSLPVNVL